MDYKTAYEKYRLLAESELTAVLSGRKNIPEPLRSAMRYSIAAGGKRVRPVLLLAACELFGEITPYARTLAAAVELIHTYSLLHDDLPCMDDDDFRRGKPANHKVFGEGMAVLAGDALLNLAYEILLENINRGDIAYTGKAAAYLALSAGGLGMVAGQCSDLSNENNPSAGEKELLYIHRHKTGCLLTASLVCGAYASGAAAPEEIEVLTRAGDTLGRLFQITDDILDVTGSAAELGKTTGKDGKNRKLTYVTLYGLNEAKNRAGAAAEEFYAELANLKQNTEFFAGTAARILTRTR